LLAPSCRKPASVWSFRDEAKTANALVPILRQKYGVEAIIVLLLEGGPQTPAPGEINACQGISGPIVAINAALDPAIDVVITGHTHLPYSCQRTELIEASCPGRFC
jgi:5'-nucleotidase